MKDDPEFWTANNASEVREAVQKIAEEIGGRLLGVEFKPILGAIRGGSLGLSPIRFSNRELRIVYFALLRALETL